MTSTAWAPGSDEERRFEAFVAESGDTLLRLAVLLTCDGRLAEDVYQETLQRLAARWKRVEEPKAFCRKVMHNLVIDRGRARGRRPRESSLLASIDRRDEQADRALVAVELRQVLLEALGTLAPTQRAVIVLRYFDDRSEAEIADLLGVSAGSVKSSASRAIAHLRARPGLAALFANV